MDEYCGAIDECLVPGYVTARGLPCIRAGIAMTIATMPSVKAQATASAQPPCVRMVILFCSLIPKRYAMVGNSQFLSSRGQSIEGRDLWGFVAQGSYKKSIC
jgi:hypothetical protein